MWTKTVFFVLLGSALVLGTPISSENGLEAQNEENQTDPVDDLVQQVNQTIREFYDKIKLDYEEALEELTEMAQSAEEISNRKLAQMKKNYEDVKKKALKVLKKKEAILEQRLAEIKSTGSKALRISQEKFDQFKEITLQKIEAENDKTEIKFLEWREKAKLSIVDLIIEQAVNSSVDDAEKKVKQVMKELKDLSLPVQKIDKQQYKELKNKLNRMNDLAKKAIKEVKNESRNDLKELRKKAEQAIVSDNTDYDEILSIYETTREFMLRVIEEELLILDAKSENMKQEILDAIDGI